MKARQRTMNLFMWILVFNFFSCWTSVDAQVRNITHYCCRIYNYAFGKIRDARYKEDR